MKTDIKRRKQPRRRERWALRRYVPIRSGTCDGPVVATLPLGPAVSNPGVTRLSAPLHGRGVADLCFTYTARGVDPLWAIDTVELVLPM
jgi:hexosaminidase